MPTPPATPPTPATPSSASSLAPPTLATPPNTGRAPHNAFTREFLARLDDRGEPDGAREAEVAGPWSVRPVPYQGGTGFALLRDWERLEEGDDPYAVFRHRETAVLAAAVLPATGREPLFRLDSEPDGDGFPLLAAAAPPPARTAPDDPRAPRAPGAPGGAGGPGAAHAQADLTDLTDLTDPADTVNSCDPADPATPNPRAELAASRYGVLGAQTISGPQVAGHLRDFDEDFAAALHLVAALVRSPVALARLLEAAGFLALEQAGRILVRSVR